MDDGWNVAALPAAASTGGARRGALALGLAGLLAAAPAGAQWAVVDVPHTVKTVLGWTAQYQQMMESYQRQVEQLRTLEKQYQQAMVSGTAYAGEPGYRERFPVRALDAGVVERCGTAPARHPMGAEQYAFCRDIVRTGNRRYNALVAMLEDVEARDGELRAAYAERAGIRPEEEGRLASNTNRILSIQGRLQNEVRNAEALMSAYEAALRALHEGQVRLGREALAGADGSSVTQGLALKAALRLARERER